MNIPVLSYVLWAVSMLAHVCVFSVLSFKKLSHTRVLQTYMAFEAIHSITLFFVFRYSTHHAYSIAYSSFGVMSFAFQLTILYELVRGTTRPLASIFRPVSVVFAIAIAAFTMGAFSFALSAHLDQSTVISVWENRVSVFVSGIICLVIFATFLLMNRFYMPMRRTPLAVAQGLFIWHYSLLFQDAFHAGRQSSWFTAFDYAVEFIYLGVLGYWMFVFWKGKETLPPVPKEYLAKVLAVYATAERPIDEEHSCK